MIIKEIKITDEHFDDFGLKPVNIRCQKDLVIVAGANGSGKTRLLNFIKNQLQNRPTEQETRDLESKIGQYEENIASWKGAISRDGQTQAKIDGLNRNIESTERNIESARKSLSYRSTLELDGAIDDRLNAVEVVPTQTHLRSDGDFNKRDNRNKAEQAENPHTSKFFENAVPYIVRVLELHFRATHPEGDFTESKRADAMQGEERLQALVEALLGTRLTLNQDGDAIIFGKPIAEARLSKGQSVLLQVCVKIHAQTGGLSNNILLLDEPETHLHPAACIDFITRLRQVASDSQIWVATHSLPIISHFYSEALLLFSEDGEVSFSGSAPERVLGTLLGDEVSVGRLREFADLPSTLAMSRFAAECLTPPDVVGESVGDSQTKQIIDSLWAKAAKAGSQVRLLDYGAGKGRVLSNMVLEESEISGRIEYVAFDKFEDDADDCRRAIENVYGDSKDRYFNSLTELEKVYSDPIFDVVLLTNVLHEITPRKWFELFGPKGLCSRILNDDGFVLIVEDQLIPVGEKAHEFGFIVLNTGELKKLFNVGVGDPDFLEIEARGGRLTAHLVPKARVDSMDGASIIDSIRVRKRNAKAEIERLRQIKDPTFQQGREHAFWVQQYANSAIALDELTAGAEG